MKQLDKDNYLSIGEFAKASGISRKNLIYYDSIDLFKPMIVMDNGYRYYYYRQLYTINMIWTLKETGMSLHDIATFTRTRTPALMIEVFEKQKRILDQEIQKLNQIKTMMGMQIEMAKQAQTVEIGSIQVLECEREPIFFGKDMYSQDGEKETLSKMISRFYQDSFRQGFTCTFPLGLYIDVKHPRSQRTSEGSRFYYHVDKSDVYKPAGMYVVGYTYGKYDERRAFYDRMYEYGANLGYELDQAIYEDYLLNEIAVSNPDQYVLKISILVKGKV